MISKIRRKLTILYTFVFGMFLLVFIGIVCSGLIWGTYIERTNEIKLMASEISREQKSVIVQYYRSTNFTPEKTPIEDDYDISGHVFYYILDRDGEIIKADLPIPVLREEVYAKIATWNPSADVEIDTVALPNDETAVLALASHKVYRGEQLIATVYAGRDVTAYSRVLIRSILTLAISALIFLILAAVIGYYLSAKVTVPIEQSIRRQKQFVADASHELRNPLSVLLTSFEAIEMDKDSILSSFASQILIDAKEEFFRLKALVNDLLTLARADTGEIKLKKERFLLEIVCEQVIRSLRSASEHKEINVKLIITKPVEVYADPERIHQLLYILIDNGIKYTPSKGEVIVELDRIENDKLQYIRIVVRDTGAGIPLEFQQQIFQRFFRIDEARSRDTEGSGLGLSIAKWIVEAHQGKISVYSELYKGSQFIVLIPNF